MREFLVSNCYDMIFCKQKGHGRACNPAVGLSKCSAIEKLFRGVKLTNNCTNLYFLAMLHTYHF